MSDTFWFDVPSLYYIPQYRPVLEELQNRGHRASLLIHENPEQQSLIDTFCEESTLPWHTITANKVLGFYNTEKPDWIIFGNSFSQLNQLDQSIGTALLYHGIGIKACYYDPELAEFNIRFTEGKFRQQQLEHLYPHAHFLETGFAKLDPLAPGQPPYAEAFNLEQHGLDPNKPTLLYAPTFYPSSIECLPTNWPKSLKDYNLIIKPHLFSYTHSKYKNQRKRFQAWSQESNVHLVPPQQTSLLPFMAIADILISEASSALFEFAALDKPVIWLDFFKLRWSYRGPLRFRFEKRMDNTILPYTNIAAHAQKPDDLPCLIKQELHKPEGFAPQRRRATQELIGAPDGRVASRISDWLEKQRR